MKLRRGDTCWSSGHFAIDAVGSATKPTVPVVVSQWGLLGDVSRINETVTKAPAPKSKDQVTAVRSLPDLRLADRKAE
jgi:hypothetical protein